MGLGLSKIANAVGSHDWKEIVRKEFCAEGKLTTKGRASPPLDAQVTVTWEFRLAISVLMHQIAWPSAREMSARAWLTDHFPKST